MKEPLVSVIIPTYNSLEYVQIAIDSVFRQTFADYEVIVVDDGSTDGTGETLRKKYGDHIRYRWQENQERSAARNTGISLACGKYFAFLDADDYWHPEKLRLQIAAIEKHRKKNPNIALVCGSAWLVNQNGQLLNKKPAGRLKHINKLNLVDYLWRPRIYAPPSNILFVGDFVQEVGCFDQSIKYGEDQDLLIRLRAKYEFAFLDKTLLYYRLSSSHLNGILKYKIDEMLVERLKVIEKAAKLINNNGIINQAKSFAYEIAGYEYCSCHNYLAGENAFRKAVALDLNCVENKDRVISSIAASGIDSTVFLQDQTVKQKKYYFQSEFYPNMQKIWPNSLLDNSIMEKKIWGVFCHGLACDIRVPKKRLDIRDLCFQAFLNYPLYFLSLTNWKLFIGNLLG